MLISLFFDDIQRDRLSSHNFSKTFFDTSPFTNQLHPGPSNKAAARRQQRHLLLSGGQHDLGVLVLCLSAGSIHKRLGGRLVGLAYTVVVVDFAR